MSELKGKTTRKSVRTSKNRRFMQAFKQAPWRNQIQLIGFFLLLLVVILLVSSVYLSISGRAATAGLSAYRMNLERSNLERQIADRNADIARLTSATVMEQRALAMGFERIQPEEAVYVVVPGYSGKQAAVLAPPPGLNKNVNSIIKPIYRQSLWDWLFSGINQLSESVSGGIQ